MSLRVSNPGEGGCQCQSLCRMKKLKSPHHVSLVMLGIRSLGRVIVAPVGFKGLRRNWIFSSAKVAKNASPKRTRGFAIPEGTGGGSVRRFTFDRGAAKLCVTGGRATSGRGGRGSCDETKRFSVKLKSKT